ncbi:hypothetical protein UMZ34_07325 [Halopseudomonas pachastrellae]|nr:hypothetical protein UMZ34_07325 [Halopseudomonas pachastrellae]
MKLLNGFGEHSPLAISVLSLYPSFVRILQSVEFNLKDAQSSS